MRWRRLALLAVVALVALLLWRLAAPGRDVVPAAAPGVPPALAVVAADPRPPAPQPAAPSGDPLPPIIDEVTLEKTEVCDGEETLVTVKAHTAGNREDGYLHYVVGAELGSAVPLRVFASSDAEGEAPPLMVRVFGRNNVVTERRVSPIRVLDCKPARRLHLTARLLPNSIGEFELSAQIVNVTAASPMRPIEARWTFGDGRSGISQGPTIVHDYSGRPQDTMFSQLLVTCEVVDAAGERLVGRTALQLLNPSFEHLAYRGIVLLYAVMTPRFPEIGRDGIVRQSVHVGHHYREPVIIDKILRYAHAVDGETTSEPVTINAARLFGTNVVGPGGVDGVVELDAAAQIFSYELTIEGRTADDRPAMGAFSIMRPPDRPTREHHTPVVDPLLKAKILRARELLKQDLVNDEDLIRLTRQGAFDDLVEEAATRPPSAESAPMPRAPLR